MEDGETEGKDTTNNDREQEKQEMGDKKKEIVDNKNEQNERNHEFEVTALSV
jgi:hypothetical protein